MYCTVKQCVTGVAGFRPAVGVFRDVPNIGVQKLKPEQSREAGHGSAFGNEQAETAWVSMMKCFPLGHLCADNTNPTKSS